MGFRRDQILDVLYVLAAIREKIDKEEHEESYRELRIQAQKEVANAEFLKGRYQDEGSAYETIRDACTRRLWPDVSSVSHFDRLVTAWLNGDDTKLREAILKHLNFPEQKDIVIDFFREFQTQEMN